MKDEFDEFLEDTYETISILSEDNQTIECFVIDGILIDNTQYLLVVPCDDFNNDHTEAFILKQINEDGEDVIYVPVEDNNEYNKILILLQENETDYKLDF